MNGECSEREWISTFSAESTAPSQSSRVLWYVMKWNSSASFSPSLKQCFGHVRQFSFAISKAIFSSHWKLPHSCILLSLPTSSNINSQKFNLPQLLMLTMFVCNFFSSNYCQNVTLSSGILQTWKFSWLDSNFNFSRCWMCRVDTVNHLKSYCV